MKAVHQSNSNAEYAQSRGSPMQERMVDPLHEPPAIGERLRLVFLAWRSTASGKRTQKEFFARAGIAPNTGSNWITGREQPRVSEAIRLCEVYNLTLDYIYRGDPSGLRYEMRDKIALMRKS
jgi:DNA-binding XRE family transcriptional regulator